MCPVIVAVIENYSPSVKQLSHVLLLQIRSNVSSNWHHSANRLIETQQNAAQAAQQAYEQLAKVRIYFSSTLYRYLICCALTLHEKATFIILYYTNSISAFVINGLRSFSLETFPQNAFVVFLLQIPRRFENVCPQNFLEFLAAQ